MESAILFLLASGMGVMFGWQPMPDGSPRYEYVVQLEPELIEALQEGQSIPISSDLPEDIQPIGRIRIVAGSGPLPRTRLSTALKPWPEAIEKKSREGVLETQYRVTPVEATGSGRYENPAPGAILPPSDTPPSNSQSFVQGLQNAAQPAQNRSQILPPQDNQAPQDNQGFTSSVQGASQEFGNQLHQEFGNQLRNVGESVRTDAQQMFGRPGDAVSGALGQVGNTFDRVQQGFQQGVEPLQQVAEQTGQQLRGAVEGIGQRTREAVDQFGRPFRESSILSTRESGSQTILPPGSAPAGQQFAGSQSGGRGQQFDQPITPPQEDSWQAPAWNNSPPITPGNNSQPAFGQTTTPAQPATSASGAFDPSLPLLPRNDYRNQATQQNQQRGQPQNWPNNTPNDRYDLANHPTASDPPPPSNTARNTAGGQSNSNNNWLGETSFPSNNANPSSQMADDARQTQRATESGQPALASAAPEIRRSSLDKPADAELQTVAGQPRYPISEPTNPSSQIQQPQASDLGWDIASRTTTNNAAPQNEDPSRALFPLVLSWVLLTGSGVGNAYLFWSFLDVRNKYHGLVHNTRGSRDRYLED